MRVNYYLCVGASKHGRIREIRFVLILHYAIFSAPSYRDARTHLKIEAKEEGKKGGGGREGEEEELRKEGKKPRGQKRSLSRSRALRATTGEKDEEGKSQSGLAVTCTGTSMNQIILSFPNSKQ